MPTFDGALPPIHHPRAEQGEARTAFNDYPVREILFADAVNVGPDDSLTAYPESR